MLYLYVNVNEVRKYLAAMRIIFFKWSTTLRIFVKVECKVSC